MLLACSSGAPAQPGSLPATSTALPAYQLPAPCSLHGPAPAALLPCVSVAVGSACVCEQKLKILEVEPGKDENEGYVTFQVGMGRAACRAGC